MCRLHVCVFGVMGANEDKAGFNLTISILSTNTPIFAEKESELSQRAALPGGQSGAVAVNPVGSTHELTMH